MHPITILSFGYLHPWPEKEPCPFSEDTFDLRDLLSDPAHVPGEEMLNRTGLDSDVAEFVFATKGADDLLGEVMEHARRKAEEWPVTVAFGCAGGRHRSVAMAESLQRWLRAEGCEATVHHLHVHLPRVIHQPAR